MSQIRFIWCARVTFEVLVAEMPRRYGSVAYLFSGGRIFLKTHLIHKVLAL